MRKKPKMIRLEAHQIRQVLQSPRWERDDKRYKAIMDAKHNKLDKTFKAVYVNEQTDEVLLEYEYGWAYLFSRESFDGFVDKLRRTRAAYESGLRFQHILAGKFPYGLDFPAQAMSLVQQLPRLMGLPPDDLDFTFDSLKSFDRILKDADLDEALEAPIFSALVAYCGEVLRRAIQGDWEMRPAQQDPDIWEPWVRSSDGTGINIGLAIYKSLEEDYPFSLEGRIRAEYELWQLRRGNQPM
jgi:hypothetical protein